MKLQRKLLYETRDRLLFGAELSYVDIVDIAKQNIELFLESESDLSIPKLSRYILDNISYTIDKRALKSFDNLDDKELIRKNLLDIVMIGLKEQEKRLGDKEEMTDFMRVATLQAIDDAWVEEVDYLQQLQSAVSGRATAQRNLVYEYHKEALHTFRLMEQEIKRNVVRNILLSEVTYDDEHKMHILYP